MLSLVANALRTLSLAAWPSPPLLFLLTFLLFPSGAIISAQEFGDAAESDATELLLPSDESNSWNESSPLYFPGSPTPEEVSYIFADLLFWQVTEGGAANWAQEMTPIGLGALYGTTTLVDAPFQWNAGFRVGFGYEARGADLKVYYTNYSTSATNSATGEVYSAFLGNFYVDNSNGADFGPHYQDASMAWDFDFHNLDIETGRTFMIDESFQLRPFVGVKAAIINQSIHTTWRNPIDTLFHDYQFTSAVEDLKQDFWGVGISFGATATLPIYADAESSLSFFASPSGSVMYGHWTFRDVYQNDGPTSTTVPTPTTVAINLSPIDGAATMARGTLGVEWTQQFSRASTTVRLGYEAQVWLNQMQLYTLNLGRLNNLMSLQGGTLEVCVNF